MVAQRLRKEMDKTSSQSGVSPLSYGANWLASKEGLPISIRAVLGYYADTGVLDYGAMKVKSYVDREIQSILDNSFAKVEEELSKEFGKSDVDFQYETKLTLPAELTLGYLYRRVLEESPSDYNPVTRKAKTETIEYFRIPFDKKRERRRNERLTEENQELVDKVELIEDVTELVVEALIDGDMRDALNDQEYEDFETNFNPAVEGGIRRIAEIAQETLQASIEERLPEFPDTVSDAYQTAVEISERHQEQDQWFRDILNRDHPQKEIRESYKFAKFESPPEVFNEEILELPYFKTQYDRVGVIYDGMIDMYRGAGLTINDDFKRSIVLAIIGAQIWLDDVGDYYDDLEEDQLTPVTAEYQVAKKKCEAYENVVDIAETYFDYAKQYATKSGTPMTGIAVEYIFKRGEPSNLPR